MHFGPFSCTWKAKKCIFEGTFRLVSKPPWCNCAPKIALLGAQHVCILAHPLALGKPKGAVFEGTFRLAPKPPWCNIVPQNGTLGAQHVYVLAHPLHVGSPKVLFFGGTSRLAPNLAWCNCVGKGHVLAHHGCIWPIFLPVGFPQNNVGTAQGIARAAWGNASAVPENIG